MLLFLSKCLHWIHVPILCIIRLRSMSSLIFSTRPSTCRCSYFLSRTQYVWHKLFLNQYNEKTQMKNHQNRKVYVIKTWRHKPCHSDSMAYIIMAPTEITHNSVWGSRHYHIMVQSLLSSFALTSFLVSTFRTEIHPLLFVHPRLNQVQ